MAEERVESSVKIAWGKLPSGDMIHVSSVKRGLACGCICADCGTPLIARQGTVKAWAFAHSVTVDCTGESALHLAAKQVLVRAANSQRRLSVASVSGDVEGLDSAGNVHVVEWAASGYDFPLCSGKEEVYLGNHVTTDVLVSAQSGSLLAVEIFVTHKKDEVDRAKYAALRQDCIEIDLSHVSWLANETELTEAVLSAAPRSSIFSLEAATLAQKASNELADRIRKRNQELRDKIESLVSSSWLFKDLSSHSSQWPTLIGKAQGEDAFGKVALVTVEETPKLTYIRSELSPTKTGWRTTGVVNEKVAVDVIFVPGYCETDDLSLSRATLVVECYLDDAFYDERFINPLRWENVDHWLDKLATRAQLKLRGELSGREVAKGRFDNYAEKFRALGDQDRLSLICEELSISGPRYVGKLSNGWNAPWSIWKGLVWKYKILRRPGGYVDVQNTADDEWFERLLDFSSSEQASADRSKALWFWFKDMERIGILEHDGYQVFRISTTLPKSFVPWEKIR